jgi:SAM-dependent methyltransferase
MPDPQPLKSWPDPPDYALWQDPKGAFKKLAMKWHETFRLQCRLEPHHRVLEIGCGAGRMAMPFESFLTSGTYVGVDIREDYIGWANQHLGSAKLSFKLLDLANPHYRKSGSDAAQAILPFADADFDFIFLTSVFTHLNSREMANYVRECARLLRPNSYMLSTFFLLNAHSHKGIADRLSKYKFRYKSDDFTWEEVEKDPGHATAIEEERALQAHSQCGLLTRTVLGAWSTAYPLPGSIPSIAPMPRHNQDIVIAYKDDVYRRG